MRQFLGRLAHRLEQRALWTKPARRIDRAERAPENNLDDALICSGREVVAPRDRAVGNDVFLSVQRMLELSLAAFEQQRHKGLGLFVAIAAGENAAQGKAPLALPVVLDVGAIDARKRERRGSLVYLLRNVLIDERLPRARGRG